MDSDILKTMSDMRMLQVSLYIAEHRLELEEEGGKDKAQVTIRAFLQFLTLLLSLQETGLARWKGLSAAEKEEYKANLLFQKLSFDMTLVLFSGGKISQEARGVKEKEK